MSTKNQNKIKYFILTSLALVVLVMTSSGVQAADPLQQGIIDQVNQERAKQGLSQLKESELLNQAASLKAQDMIGNNYFSHTSPKGVNPWSWLEEVGYKYKYAGENLAMDFSSAYSVHRAWMKSETHKENILSDKYDEIGVAVLEGVIENRETRVAVQFFGTALKKEREKQVSQIIQRFDTSVTIEDANVHPWQETVGDEMLIYAKISGEPQQVEAVIGDQKFQLEELQTGKYMNLIALESVDLNENQIVVRAETNEKQSVFYQIPKDQYAAYLEQNKNEQGQLATTIAQVKSGNQLLKERSLNSQSLFLVGFMVVCLIMIANVWILEKEEEKLIERASQG